MQTGQFGNMLLLDDDPNLADSDKPYTEVTFIIYESHIQSGRPKRMKQDGHAKMIKWRTMSRLTAYFDP